MPKFPNWLFVREEEERDGTKYLLNYNNQPDAVNGDGPTKVATYQLVKVKTLTKVVQFAPPKPRRKSV